MRKKTEFNSMLRVKNCDGCNEEMFFFKRLAPACNIHDSGNLDSGGRIGQKQWRYFTINRIYDDGKIRSRRLARWWTINNSVSKCSIGKKYTINFTSLSYFCTWSPSPSTYFSHSGTHFGIPC